MYVKKNFGFKEIMRFSGWHIIWLTLWAIAVPAFIETLHYFRIESFKVPWLPVSLVGTAVAFYVGFKNNSSYDRLWEARKIWGAIVNSSRMWGSIIKAYVSNQFTEDDLSENDLQGIQKRMIYRHIGWLYSLRSQLLLPTSWEHVTQGRMMKKRTEQTMKVYGVGLFNDHITKEELPQCLPAEEIDRLVNAQNTATQIIDQQAQDLKELRSRDLIDDFRHMELQKVLNDFYIHQGQAERIKKFPLPRQYASMSFMFVGIFIFLLPFGLVTEFHDLSAWGAWLSIPFTVIVGWVFLMMELIGDYSENPFEGLGNDIPMLALCRTIEIDLKEMLGDELPPAIEPVNNVLM
jgi:putative membrane protein|tara:strand:- start:107 stop:1150 length:1044 start_codon:yes stop_codon:yes gene_type:complete